MTILHLNLKSEYSIRSSLDTRYMSLGCKMLTGQSGWSIVHTIKFKSKTDTRVRMIGKTLKSGHGVDLKCSKTSNTSTLEQNQLMCLRYE